MVRHSTQKGSGMNVDYCWACMCACEPNLIEIAEQDLMHARHGIMVWHSHSFLNHLKPPPQHILLATFGHYLFLPHWPRTSSSLYLSVSFFLSTARHVQAFHGSFGWEEEMYEGQKCKFSGNM